MRAFKFQIKLGLFKGSGRLVVNFSCLRHGITKLGPQRITVKISEVNQAPLLEESSIVIKPVSKDPDTKIKS